MHEPSLATALRSTPLALLAVVVLSVGCATPPASQAVATRAAAMRGGDEAPAATSRRSLPPYRLEVGDRIAIQFPYARELDADARVRPDGRISVPRAGEIEALGLTPGELEQTLATALAGGLVRPEPRVVVREFRTPRVFVGGAVRAPGAFDFHEQLTALRAITAAGGAAPSGALDAVVILREAADGTMRRFRLDLESWLRSGSGTDPILAPNDLVFVPHHGEVGDGEVGSVSDRSGTGTDGAQARIGPF